jgi:hypothetical protein
MSMFHNR